MRWLCGRLGWMLGLSLLGLSLLGLLSGCGSAATKAGSTEPPGAVEEPRAPSRGAPTPAREGPSDEGDAEAEAEDDGTPQGPRELTYHVRSGGLMIEIDDVEFEVRATAVRVGRGFGVEVTVEATHRGSGTRSLLTPSRGALAFAGTVRGEAFTDTREGEGEALLESGRTLTLSRKWPEGDVKPLRSSESLELMVGLWGLGRDAKTRQPIRQFFSVKMKGGKKPVAVVAPPEAFMGSEAKALPRAASESAPTG